MAQRPVSGAVAVAIYGNALIIGGVLMGFEVLGSRYLFPYFGGSMQTWASLIATVLIALAVGYFGGGLIADRFPSPQVILDVQVLAAVYLAAVPTAADSLLSWVMQSVGDGEAGVLAGALALSFVPLMLLGTLSPVAIRLLMQSVSEGGRTAGWVYGISTLGNVIGTLGTTFILIPMMGSRSITYLYAAALALSAAAVMAVARVCEKVS